MTKQLYPQIHDDVHEFFNKEGIKWHRGQPSNNPFSSQLFCINCLFPLLYQKEVLREIVNALGYPVREILPFRDDISQDEQEEIYLTFEWPGERNYLNERRWGTRGVFCTSADFALRFKREDNKIQIILGEWKFTEKNDLQNKVISRNGTDRVEIYRKLLSYEHCQVKTALNSPAKVNPAHLFIDPYYQLMRLHLLASEMQKKSESQADYVSVLQIISNQNPKFLENESENLSFLGSKTLEIWERIVETNSFTWKYAEDLVEIIIANVNDNELIDFLRQKYLYNKEYEKGVVKMAEKKRTKTSKLEFLNNCIEKEDYYKELFGTLERESIKITFESVGFTVKHPKKDKTFAAFFPDKTDKGKKPSKKNYLYLDDHDFRLISEVLQNHDVFLSKQGIQPNEKKAEEKFFYCKNIEIETFLTLLKIISE